MNNDTFEIRITDTIVTAYSHIRGNRLKYGDMYIARRNGGWQLGKCYKVDHENNYVMSDPPGKLYSYNYEECFKVKDIVVLPNF